MGSAIARLRASSALVNTLEKSTCCTSSTSWGFPVASNSLSTQSATATPGQRSGWQADAYSSIESGESVPLGTISSMGNAGVEYMNRSLGGGMLPTSLGFWISGRRKEWATFLRDDLKDDAPTLLAVGAVEGRTIDFTCFVEDYAAIRIHSRSARERLEHAVHPSTARPGCKFEDSPL